MTSEAQASQSVVVDSSASALAAPTFEGATDTESRRTGATQRGFWSGLRKVVVCVAAVGVFIAGNALWITKLKKAGGLWKNAKKLVRKKGKRRKLKVLTGIFGNVLGLDTIAKKC